MHILVIILGVFLLLLFLILATKDKKPDTSKAPCHDLQALLAQRLQGWIVFPAEFAGFANCSVRIEPLWKEHICLLDIQVFSQETKEQRQYNLVLELQNRHSASIHTNSILKNAKIFVSDKSVFLRAGAILSASHKSYKLEGEFHALDSGLILGCLHISRFGIFSKVSASLCLMGPQSHTKPSVLQ